MSAKKSHKLLIQFAEYMVSGGAWFWVGYVSFAILDKVFHLPFWPTKLSSYVIGASFNFALQHYWVFRQGKSNNKQLGDSAKRYYVLMVGNFFLDQAIVGGLRAVGITPYIGQFVASGFFTAWNWLWYSNWVFKKKKKLPPHRTYGPALAKQKKKSATKSRKARK
jgi:putative flippase GtrA